MALMRIYGVVATSAPMDVYGGVAFTEKYLEGLANSFTLGPTTFGVRHDPRREIPTTIVETLTRRRDDGFLEFVIGIDVDDTDWDRHGGDSLDGFSITRRKPFLSTGNNAATITLAADAHWFSDDQLRRSFDDLSLHFKDVEATWLYQFSTDPSTLVIVQLALGDLSSLGIGLLTNYLYDALRHLIRPEKNTSREPSKFSIELTDGLTGRTVKAYVETNSERTLKHALNTLPAALGSELTRLEFSSDDDEWAEDSDSPATE